MYLRIFGFVGARIFWLSTIHDQIHFNNAQSVCFHGDHEDAQRLSESLRRNQQLMPSNPPKSYVWSITNTLNIIRMLFSVSTSSNNNIQKIYIGCYTK